jgi:hypothetical protein
MVRISITQAAFEAIVATLPLRSVGYENKTDEHRQRLIWRDGVVGPSSIPALGDRVMLSTAWIDRPVDTRGCTPASTSLPCSMEVQPCPCHLRPVIRLRH